MNENEMRAKAFTYGMKYNKFLSKMRKEEEEKLHLKRVEEARQELA